MVNTEVKELKKFGILFSLIFIVISLSLFFKQKNFLPWAGVSFLFFLLAIYCPNLLKVLYRPWMKLASFLSWVNTGLILFLMFYLIFLPIGLLLKLLGKDLLDIKIDKNKASYWKSKDKDSLGLGFYQRQF
jgi:hypothetical protein